MLAEQSLITGDRNMAFAHSYITHSVIFPSIKNILEKTGFSNSAKQLESELTDITFSIKTWRSRYCKEKLDRGSV